MITVDELMKQIDQLTTTKQVPAVYAQVETFLKTSSEAADVTLVQETLGRKLIQLGAQTEAESANSLRLNGIHYSLTEWLTPSQYIKRINISNLSTIAHWVRSGTIPADSTIYVEELGVRLVKAVEYRSRSGRRSTYDE